MKEIVPILSKKMVLFETLESMPQKGKPRFGGMPDRGYLMRIIERLEATLAGKQKEHTAGKD